MAKGGGAWKVAYADFVTAMMAFFLVMWICSQDQKIKRAVADYFGDPVANKRGISKTPEKAGSFFEAVTTGTMPQAESVALGRGRLSFTPAREKSRLTKLVSDWISTNKEAQPYWHAQAQRLQEWVRLSPNAEEDGRPAFKAATRELAKQFKEEITRDATREAKGIYQDLLFEAMAGVNWMEVAEELLEQ
jgi:flagellar motor protein MotB